MTGALIAESVVMYPYLSRCFFYMNEAGFREWNFFECNIPEPYGEGRDHTWI